MKPSLFIVFLVFIFTSCVNESNKVTLSKKDSLKISIQHNDKGLEFAKTKKYVIAIKYFDSALIFNCKSEAALANRAIANYLMGNYIAAKKDNLSVIAINPDNFYSLFDLGRIALKEKKYGESLNYCNSVLKLCKEDSLFKSNVFQMIGEIHYLMGDIEKSIVFSDSSLMFSKDFGDAFLIKGKCEVSRSNLKKACVYFNNAKQLGSENAEENILKYCTK